MIVLLLLVLLSSVNVFAADNDFLLKKFQTLSANVVQEGFNSDGKKIFAQKGFINLKKPDFFRLDLGKSTLLKLSLDEMLFVEPELEQVTVLSDNNVLALPHLLLSFDVGVFARYFMVSLVKQAIGFKVYQLLPVKPFANVSAIKLYIRDLVIEKLIIYDVNDSYNVLKFTDIVFDQNIDDALDFEIPKKYDVIKANNRS